MSNIGQERGSNPCEAKRFDDLNHVSVKDITQNLRNVKDVIVHKQIIKNKDLIVVCVFKNSIASRCQS